MIGFWRAGTMDNLYGFMFLDSAVGLYASIFLLHRVLSLQHGGVYCNKKDFRYYPSRTTTIILANKSELLNVNAATIITF